MEDFNFDFNSDEENQSNEPTDNNASEVNIDTEISSENQSENNENDLLNTFNEISKLISDDVYEKLPDCITELTSNFDGRERDVVLLALIGTISSCIPNIYGIYDGHKVYSNLYILIVAPPASGKGVMNFARNLIIPLHSEIKSTSEFERNECKKEKLKKNKHEKDFSECPTLVVKLAPANSSSAEIYSFLNASKDGILIFESEADTLSKMFKNDWGDFSDILRKAFHHEFSSISRSRDELYFSIDQPRISLVLSSTPNQLKQLIVSKSNGLFSRFLIYSFNERGSFHNVFSTDKARLKDLFDKAGWKLRTLYHNLNSTQKEIRFCFTPEQETIFLQDFQKGYDLLISDYGDAFSSSFKRHGLIMFRICMILTVLKLNFPLKDDTIYCDDASFEAAFEMIRKLIYHSGETDKQLTNKYFTDLEEKLFYSLSEKFHRSTAIEVGKKLNISVRTIDEKLKKWCEDGKTIKISHGYYRRVLN